MVVARANGGVAIFQQIKELQSCKMKKVMDMDGGNGCTTLQMYLISLNSTQKWVRWQILRVFYHNKNRRKSIGKPFIC